MACVPGRRQRWTPPVLFELAGALVHNESVKATLVAIALETGRAKDHARILQFLEQSAVDRQTLKDIVERHGLSAKWSQFEQRFLKESQ